MISVFIYIAIILTTVILHEFGHYFAARLQGVSVKSFSVGFGPVLYRFKRWGTEWRLSLLPLGGYNEIEGIAKPGSVYESRPLWGKLAILLSGLVVNLVLAFLAFSLIFSINGKPTAIPNTYVVAAIMPGSPADGILKPGDLVLSLNNGFPPTVRSQSDLDIYQVQRGPEVLTLAVPSSLGVNTGITYTEQTTKESITFWQSMLYTPSYFLNIGQIIFSDIYSLLTFQTDNSLSGPVGSLKLVSTYDVDSFLPILIFFAVINLALFMTNSIPFPLMDGGQAVMAVVRHFWGGPLSPKVEFRIALTGYFIFVYTLIAVIFQDFKS